MLTLEASSRCLLSPHRVTQRHTSLQGAKKSNYLVNSTNDFQILTLSYFTLVFLFVNLKFLLICFLMDYYVGPRMKIRLF